MACRHCSSGSGDLEALPGELTLVEHISLIEQARALGATVLSLSGGEPLTYPDLPILVNTAKQEGYEKILIYTTGRSIGKYLIQDYSDINRLLGIDEVTWVFSLHSHLSDMNDWIMRRNGAFSSIVGSIRWLIAEGEKVEIHMVPMAPNFTHINGVRDACETIGVKQLSLLRFVPQTRGLQNVDDLAISISQFEQMQHMMDAELERNENHSVTVRLGCPIDFRHAVGLLPKKVKPCHAGDDLMLVRPTGDVHPCAAWKSCTADANVKTMLLADIWEHSVVFNAIRDFKAGGYKQIEPCNDCVMVDSCLTGCPAQRLHAGNRDLEDLYVNRSDPLCPLQGEGYEL